MKATIAGIGTSMHIIKAPANWESLDRDGLVAAFDSGDQVDVISPDPYKCCLSLSDEESPVDLIEFAIVDLADSEKMGIPSDVAESMLDESDQLSGVVCIRKYEISGDLLSFEVGKDDMIGNRMSLLCTKFPSKVWGSWILLGIWLDGKLTEIEQTPGDLVEVREQIIVFDVDANSVLLEI
jgi:hypothetical protein